MYGAQYRNGNYNNFIINFYNLLFLFFQFCFIYIFFIYRNFEVAVDGRKQGATKNKRGNYLLVARKSFFTLFLKTLDKDPRFKNLPTHPKIIKYYHCKQWSIEYQKLWNYLKLTIFKTWPIKPIKLQQFSL